MFGSSEIVRGTAKIFKGHLIEAFDQGDRIEGLRGIFDEIPEARRGVCKSLCMNWIVYHAKDEQGSFAEFARSKGSGKQRSGGHYAGVGIVMNQLNYSDALGAATSRAHYLRIKDQFTDDFMLKHGLVRQMKMTNPTLNLSNPGLKMGRTGLGPNTAFAWRFARSIVGKHSANYWSYKIISIHGPAGGHAVAAFVGADALFFDPNYGIFYFEKAADFLNWFGAPGGFYWVSNYLKHLGDDYVIKSYALAI